LIYRQKFEHTEDNWKENYMSHNKTSFITNIEKIEKAYLKAADILQWVFYSYHSKAGHPQKELIYKNLKTSINDPRFILSNKLLDKVKQITDLINLRTKYPNHFLLEFLLLLDDLLVFIVHGYYSTDFQSYSEKLFEYFDLVFHLNEAITPYIKQDTYEHKFSYLLETKTQWFEATRHLFRELIKLDIYGIDDYEAFENDPDTRGPCFTIKIVNENLQILFRKTYKPTNIYEDHYDSYKIIDEFNKKNYKFKLNFQKIFNENIVKESWYTYYLLKFYFRFESLNFPDSNETMKKQKSQAKANIQLDQYSNNKNEFFNEIKKRIDENSGVAYILKNKTLQKLNNQELILLLPPLIRILKAYSKEHIKTGNQMFYSYRDQLLKGYFELWKNDKTSDLYYDGYYSNFYYYTSKVHRFKENEMGKVDINLKLHNDGTISLGKESYAQGRYIYSANKIVFYLKGSSKYFNVVVYEGVVDKDEINLSSLYGKTIGGHSLPKGIYKFTKAAN